jgi:hypothetical protein
VQVLSTSPKIHCVTLAPINAAADGQLSSQLKLDPSRLHTPSTALIELAVTESCLHKSTLLNTQKRAHTPLSISSVCPPQLQSTSRKQIKTTRQRLIRVVVDCSRDRTLARARQYPANSHEQPISTAHPKHLVEAHAAKILATKLATAWRVSSCFRYVHPFPLPSTTAVP